MKIKEKFVNQSLKTKWMMTTGITIFISYAAICVIIFFALQTWLLNNEEKNALRTVDDVTSFLNSQGLTVTIQELQQNTGLMKAILNQDQTVRIYSLTGKELLQINDTSPAFPVEATLSSLDGVSIDKIKVDKTNAFVIHKIVRIGPIQGVMQLIHPLTTYESMMNYVLTTMLIMGIGAILLAASISYYVSSILIRPLQQLRDSMTAVKERGFEEKIDFNYYENDEIGDIIRIYEAMLNELEISFTQQQQFVSDASHELRTPIQAVEGHLSLIKRWGKHNPEVLEESIDTSLIEIARVRKMIEELLKLARRESIDEDETANIEEIINIVQEELQFIYPTVEIEKSVVGQILPLSISEQALTQIIRNLFENSIRYNVNKPIIKVSIHYRIDNIFVEIQDNGIGIDEEHLPYIFDRFYRVDDARVHVNGSTGLGLSITKMLIDKYNAKMEVRSELEKGTIFLLCFPSKK
ncbi:sensor histidine kinase [Lysinibacillus sp. 54212]|uniref:sensor histidine kinase n=1 Tax=Lysinibacillus sp. 54212 TaxID=3119829 RepID=UPI002FC6E322